FFIILQITVVKIEDVLGNQNIFGNPLSIKMVNDIAFQLHNVVFHRIVPFSYKFYNSIVKLIVHKKDFQIQRAGAKFIPLRMDIIIINGVGKFKLAVFLPVVGGVFIFFGGI